MHWNVVMFCRWSPSGSSLSFEVLIVSYLSCSSVTLLALILMCRLSDLASQATHLKQDGSHVQLCLRRSQITFHSDRMMVTLAGTKNDASRDGFVIPVFSCPGTNLDPVTALRAWNTQRQCFSRRLTSVDTTTQESATPPLCVCSYRECRVYCPYKVQGLTPNNIQQSVSDRLELPMVYEQASVHKRL